MVDAGLVVNILCTVRRIVIEYGLDGHGQVVGVGRRAGLVEHHVQLRLGGGQVKHRLDEVPAILGIKPGSTDDDVFAARLLDIALAFQFGLAVNACRGAFLVLTAGGVIGITAKHVVGGNLNQQTVDGLHGLGQDFRGLGIELAAQGYIAFGLVHIGIGRTVDNAPDVLFRHHAVDGFGIGDVENGGLHAFGSNHVRKDIVMAGLSADQTHLVAKLSVGTGYQYVHFRNQYKGSLISNGESKSFSSGCLVSFSLRMALPVGMRQSMPRLSSRMLIPPSA